MHRRSSLLNSIVSPIQTSSTTTPTIINPFKSTLGRHIARRLVEIGITDVLSVPVDFNLTLLGHLIVLCEEELIEAVETAKGPKKDSLCFIEVTLHKDDTSKELLEWGSRIPAANSRPPKPQQMTRFFYKKKFIKT
ncbi:hypothetical protein CFOL_v3_17063 [Cephalotus follicularis]|uniref:Uncharacterized protein n=1 Tax=Cephalotus follicularis TaxID=3775 RepID=A0A1Q3C0A1_CEPFO|nr:hypothetical protein CFOL_v3_17063 [Cephalotus follicularis]